MKECEIDGCGRRHWAKGFCQKHYMQMQRGVLAEDGSLQRPLKRVSSWKGETCRQPGCEAPVRTRGWCNQHYLQFRSGIIDEDGKQLRDPKWRRGKGWRSYCRGYRKVMSKGHPNSDRDGYVLEHRLVMEKHLGRLLESGEVVHHINGERSDNRIENLQLRRSRKDHGHGHERMEDVESALAVLEELVNKGMTGGADIKKRLQRVARRL